MWRLWHKLFGWDYIQWSSAGLYGIARIRIAPSGLVYFLHLGEVVRLNELKPRQITYLTCSKDKYLK